MKKVLLACFALIATLSACHKEYKVDPYAEFRHQTAAELFAHAQQSLREEDYDYAAGVLEALDAIYPFGPYAQRGQLDVVYAYYKSGDASDAMTAAERYLHLYPRSPHADYAHYMRGLASFETGISWVQKKLHVNLADRDTASLRKAFQSFQAVLQRTPHSRYAPSARYYLIKIRNMMAEHEFHVAEYYWQQKAYVATINRAAVIVQHYEGTVWVPKALRMMQQSYQSLGLKHEAHKITLLLQHNFDTPQMAKPAS